MFHYDSWLAIDKKIANRPECSRELAPQALSGSLGRELAWRRG
jgi:hypothetical protein